MQIKRIGLALGLTCLAALGEATDLSHRMATLRIQTTPGATIRVEQQSHHFWFGTAVSARFFSEARPTADHEKYLSVLKDNFNSVVPENAMKWASTNRRPGASHYASCDRIVEWCRQNDFRIRGHCIYWGLPKYVQPWVKQLDNKALRAALEARAVDLLEHYRGRVSEFDVNNEMLHGHYFADRLGEPIRQDMFHWAHQANPDSILYVNDYSILSGGSLPKYEQQIEALIAAGAPVGGIGLQAHFGEKGVDPAKVKRSLDSLARFNLPIKITEFDVKSLDEQLKARSLEDLYRTAFAHPAVNGILMWGFWQGSHWLTHKDLGAGSYTALWDKNWNPTPSAEIYRKLVYDEWWTRFQGKADDKGLCEIPVFLGKHKLTIGKASQSISLTEPKSVFEVSP